NYRICIKFNTAELRPIAGRTNYVPVVFESYTKKGDPNLTGIVMSVDHADNYPGLIIEPVRESLSNQNVGSASLTRFTTKVGIKSDARTDNYPLSLLLSSGTDTAKGAVEISLPILGADKSSVSVERTSDNE